MGRQVVRYQRDDQEFGRAIGFFDATYALALTLLVTTLDVPDPPSAWDGSVRSGTPSDRQFALFPSAEYPPATGSTTIAYAVSRRRRSTTFSRTSCFRGAAGRMIRRTADPAFCGRNHLGVDLSGTVHSPGDHLCGDQQEQPKQADDR